jgi:hypothetical protein
MLGYCLRRIGAFSRLVDGWLRPNDDRRGPASTRIGFRTRDCRPGNGGPGDGGPLRPRLTGLRGALPAARGAAKKFFDFALQCIAGRTWLALRGHKLPGLHLLNLRTAGGLRRDGLRRATGRLGRPTRYVHRGGDPINQPQKAHDQEENHLKKLDVRHRRKDRMKHIFGSHRSARI